MTNRQQQLPQPQQQPLGSPPATTTPATTPTAQPTTAPPAEPAKPAATVTAIVKDKPKTSLDLLKEGLDKWRGAIGTVLPKHMPLDRMIKTAINVYMNKPELQKCTWFSMIRATMQCAELGLDASPLLGEAHFVPFENTVQVRDGQVWKPRKQLEVQLIPGYMGLAKLVKQSGDVSDVYAVAVDDSERAPVWDENGRLVKGFFVERGTVQRIHHVPNFDNPTGNLFAAYGVVLFKDGTNHFEVFGRRQIELIRSTSKGYISNPNTSPWTTHEEAMWKKTMIRQVAKSVPKSPDKPLAKALAADTAVDLGQAFRSELSEELLAEGGAEPEIQVPDLNAAPSRTDLLSARLGVVQHDNDGVIVESR